MQHQERDPFVLLRVVHLDRLQARVEFKGLRDLGGAGACALAIAEDKFKCLYAPEVYGCVDLSD